MKKILTILVALVTFTGIASAQISVKKSQFGKPKEMTTLSMSWSWIYKSDNSYYLTLKSDNQFDDWYWLNIGDNKQDCLNSISALKDLILTMRDTDAYNVDNGEGETFTVTIGKELGIRKLIFHGKYHAGEGYLLESNLQKAAKWIEKNVK